MFLRLRAAAKRPRVDNCDQPPLRLEEKRIGGSAECPITRITLSNETTKRVYLHEGCGIRVTEKWLESLSKVTKTDPCGHEPLLINGMIKTGNCSIISKRCWSFIKCF